MAASSPNTTFGGGYGPGARIRVENMRSFGTLLILSAGVWACEAPVGDEKPKVELAEDYATTLDAAETASGGRWAEVQRVESAHPYRDNFQQTWTINGAADTARMRVIFDRFETESGYDFVTITGASGAPQRLSGTLVGREVIVEGNRVQFEFRTDGSVTGWGFSARVLRSESCICPALFDPQCGVDGQTYSNTCAASCAGVGIAHGGQCGSNQWTRVPRLIESAHPYANNFTNTWTISEGGATNMRVHFARIETERNYDFVRILDANDRVVATYTGTQRDITTAVVNGDTIKIQLSTDGSVTAWGFSVDWYEASGGCATDSECGPDQRCVEIQCLRAPCFNVCEAINPGPVTQNVTVAQLEGSPDQFNGLRIRVEAEPGAASAVCTRRGCPASDPCCNACNASIQLGTSIELRDATNQAYACSGNECNWQAGCREFAAQGSGRYEIEGTFTVDQFGSRQLRVDTFRALDCQRGGCSGQICSNRAGVVSTCEFRPEYACYQQAECGAQSSGHCGFTQTPELQMCLAGATQTTATFRATDVPMAIPDNNAAGAISRLAVTGAGNVAAARLSLVLRHSYRGDLLVTVSSPDGRRHVLHNRQGGSADDLVLTDVELPLAGATRAGTWQLQVVDGAAQDTGRIESWQLTVR